MSHFGSLIRAARLLQIHLRPQLPQRFLWLLLLSLSILPTGILSGCKQQDTNETIHVVCTVFPQYDWVRQILGEETDDVEVTLLLDKRIDLHSYQPSIADIAKISACDLFIFVGGESDAWVHDALATATNKNMITLNLLDALGASAKDEEFKEGMSQGKAHEDELDDEDDEHSDGQSDEHGDEHDDEHSDEHDDEHDNEHNDQHNDHTEDNHTHAHEDGELDEHVWLSLKNAQLFCAIIADALSSLCADKAAIYQNNLAAYVKELSALDTAYQTAADTAAIKTLLFADRFPFRYLLEDYGLDYYAAFTGCSAETEASFETIIFLAEKTDELALSSIMVTESADQSIAVTVREHTLAKNQEILVLDSLQSLSRADITNGATYLSVMTHNLEILKDALQ